MLIIAGTLRVDPDYREAFFEAVAPMVEASRAEAGCRAYVFSPDSSKPDLIHLHELWEDQAALDDHGSSVHMAAWRQAAAELPIRERNLFKYEVAHVEPLA